jgi:hypothetical protein
MSKELEIAGGSAIDKLRASYPQHAEDNYTKNVLPQIRFKAKAVLDDDDKVVTKAGTFVRVVRSEEKNADDKYEYTETPIGTDITVDVLYERYKLNYYNAGDNTYVSSPVFDQKEEITKLFSSGKEIASGTVAELQGQYLVEKDGKKKSELQLLKVLYVLYEGEVHEMTLSLGNGFAWRKYKQETMVPLVHTKIASKKTEHGGNKYNAMTFTAGEYLTEEEAKNNLEIVEDIKKGIEEEKAFFGQQVVEQQAMTALPEGDDF